uniref:NADP-dependent oxidoreductase domain-containing protein n=1 Tax=Timema shepardi TaxID=629360 RepID=A0A7R9AST3_TIMSH|nr:unnamed protein product [Timema shepardi]
MPMFKSWPYALEVDSSSPLNGSETGVDPGFSRGVGGVGTLMRSGRRRDSSRNVDINILQNLRAPPGEVEQAVKTAIDVGYRHFDCAFLYANEKEIGSAIRSKISEEGVVKREDLYITSKLWNTHHRPAGVLSACKKSLENFGLDYLDLYLLHWPVAFKTKQTSLISLKSYVKELSLKTSQIEGDDLFPKDKSGNFLTEDIDYLDTYLAMEECVRQKLTRSIGVSNFNSEQVTRVLEKSSIKPVMNQVRYFTQLGFCLQSVQPRGCIDSLGK